MLWNIAIVVVWIGIAATVAAIVSSYKKKRTGLSKPVNVFLAGTAISVFLGLIPINYAADVLSDNKFIRVVESIALSLAHAMQVFTINADTKDILDTVSDQGSFFLQQQYIATMSLLCAVAPLLTVGVLVSVLMSLSAKRRYFFSFFKTAYIFSELNERSITLAEDLRSKHPESVIVFTDTADKEELIDLVDRAKAIRAILFKDDIMSQNFNLHSKKAEIMFFVMSDNETENITVSLNIIEKYKDRVNTKLYLLSSSVESALALSSDTVRASKVKVYRINEVRSLIYRTLYERGYNLLFKDAAEYSGTKYINAVILGMGKYGTEMMKALAWFCQMDGYKLSICAVDKDKNAESEFKAMCPDLLSENKKGDDEYSIIVHSGVDVDTYEFAQFSATMTGEKRPTFIFISLGSDEKNIKAAADMRRLWKRRGAAPVILTVVYNSAMSKALADSTNFKGEKYSIDCIGDIQHEYSESVIIKSDLETKALERHLKWGDEDSFWRYEYNYNSSVAPVIHFKVRNSCGVHGSDKLKNASDTSVLTPDEIKKLRCLEHRRWNAYLRSEGYTYGEKRDDIAKTHYDLVPFSELSQTDQEKDEII